MVTADSGQAALAHRRRQPSADDPRGHGASQLASRDGCHRTPPRRAGALQAAGTPMKDHQIRTFAQQGEGTHVAVCQCGWRSEPTLSGDDAAAVGLMHQLRML
jgi:hypothetical protein